MKSYNELIREVEKVSEQEQRKLAIEKYSAIQRIKEYGNKEIEYQEQIAVAELNVLGISVEDLKFKK